MTKAEKEKYINSKSIGLCSCGLIGVCVKAIEYDINDSVIYTIGSEVHKVRLYNSVKRGTYFNSVIGRIYLDECIRSEYIW